MFGAEEIISHDSVNHVRRSYSAICDSFEVTVYYAPWLVSILFLL